MDLKQVMNELGKLNNWSLEGNAVVKVFEFKEFKDSIDFVNEIAKIAESLKHHPDIIINYSKVKLRIFTHYEKALTEKDFELASEIDKQHNF